MSKIDILADTVREGFTFVLQADDGSVIKVGEAADRGSEAALSDLVAIAKEQAESADEWREQWERAERRAGWSIGRVPNDEGGPGHEEAYWLRQKLQASIVHLRDIEDYLRMSGTPRSMDRADRARSLYEQISADFVNGKIDRLTMRQRAERAEQELVHTGRGKEAPGEPSTGEGNRDADRDFGERISRTGHQDSCGVRDSGSVGQDRGARVGYGISADRRADRSQTGDPLSGTPAPKEGT